MPRPVGKTIQADWWDADESVTYRAALNLLELQQVEQGLVTFGELMSAPQQDMPKVCSLIADMVMAVLLPAKFRVHVVDSEPGPDGIKPWVAFEQAAIAQMPADDLLHLIQEIPYRRRTVAQAPVLSQASVIEQPGEERDAGATFPTGGDERPSLNGASTPALQPAV